MSAADRYRLPRTVVPSRYQLTLEPDLAGATFAGEVAIAVDVTEVVDEIVLNAIELDIDEAWVTDDGDRRTEAGVGYDVETERATLTLASSLAAGSATVHCRFRGTLNDKLHGFYRSTFSSDGVEQVIATTQFEATDARRAFPCWDEPDFKAVFAITLVIDDDLSAVSNGAELSRRPDVGRPGKIAVAFADTMIMSTYLVAFVVGSLELTDEVDVGGIPLRVAHLPGKSAIAQFALESGAFALRYFQEYFDLPYPGGKLDLLAIPDFAFGAMENLGCITFRESALLVDSAAATQAELQRVADVIHHEIAHMWFGDLVTMKWWNGIWLNEAFATFMEMRCTDAFRPEWDRWTDFGIARSAAYDTDALASTRPIEFEVVSPADAEGMFDILTYEKGAAVVRMLEQYLGEERFRSGIRRYMVENQYANTDTVDLWDAIEAATDEPVRRIMDSWIFQGGHPVVVASRQGKTLRLSQEPMSYLGAEPPAAHWSVPLLVRELGGTQGGTDRVQRVLLEGDTADVELAADSSSAVVNSGGSGFFRVRYQPADLLALTGRGGLELTPLERYNLVDDMWASVLAGTTSMAELCDFLRRFADETDLSVWQRIIGITANLDRFVAEADRPRLAGFVRALVGPALRQMGSVTDGEPARRMALRGVLFEALGSVGADPAVRDEARALVDGGPEGVDPNLFDAAVRVSATAGDERTFDQFLDRSRAATNPQDVLRYLGALADIPGDGLAARFAELMLSDQVRSQDGPYLLRRGLANRDHQVDIWAFVHREWARINHRFPSNSISRLLDGIRTVTDPGLATDIEAFLAEHPVPQAAQTVAQHLERMRVGVAVAARAQGELAAALP